MKYLTFFSKIICIFFVCIALMLRAEAGDGIVVKASNYHIDKSSGEKTKNRQ